jgi:hypothetical protein
MWGAPSDERTGLLQMLLALASAVIFGSESRGTSDHILLSQIRDFPFRRLLRLAGLRWRYSTPPPQRNNESYITTDGQSACLSWNKSPIWGLRPDFITVRQLRGLLTWGANEGFVDVGRSLTRGRVSFTFAASPRQRSHSRVRVSWDLRPHFTLSDSRLPFSSPPTTRKATVEVFDPTSTRD